jgi:hypothetical protein
MFTLASKMASGVTLLILFPLLTLAVAVVALQIPIITLFVEPVIVCSALGLLLLPAMGIGPGDLPHGALKAIIFLHYPTLGFAIGVYFPFEVALTRACAMQIAIRCGLLLIGIVIFGMAVTLIVFSGDS